ncbi:MAG: RpiB/LacA/LacB family sugar-phosphate isomerase [Candidatus Pacebacteria bacterium]|nr:RpiB/LacA/LacB family sugar-phosphate isomerase [Candidatus Paceibacterota bacterium]
MEFNGTIHLATDHAGFEMKEFLKTALEELNYNFVDHGADVYDQNDDYPDYIKLAAGAVSQSTQDRAIIFGGSGQGEAIVANRYPNVRATTYYHFNPEIIKLSREHNNANILSIGARFLSNEEMLESVLFWLEIPFTEEERHIRRIEKIEFDSFDN